MPVLQGREEGHGTEGRKARKNCGGRRAAQLARQERGAAAAPDGQSAGGVVWRQGPIHHAGSERQASQRDSPLGNRAQHSVSGGPWRKTRARDPEGLADGSYQRKIASRGSSSRGHGRSHEGDGSGT